MARNRCIFRRILVSCAAALLLPVWANALDAGTEASYVKIMENPTDGSPPPDLGTLDDNGDGLVDRAQFRLLDAVLRDDSAPHHAETLAAYQANLTRFTRDNTLGVRCVFMEALYHFTCDDFNRFAAGTFTLANPTSIQMLVSNFADSADIILDPANYNLSLAGLLPGNGDLDGDGYTNVQEYAAVCGNIDAYVAAATDAAKNPATLPCCMNCVLQITGEPQDAQKYAGQPLTLSVTVKDAEGTVHYQWYRGDDAVGADASELALASLRVADGGPYRCVVTDASETVTSRTAQVTVADHMRIAAQPQSARRHLGDAHTFDVAVTGGLPPVHFQWMKDGNAVGDDSPQFALAEIAETDAGRYWCTVTDLYERVVSAHVELIVMQPGEGEDQVGFEGESPAEGETPAEGEIVVEGEAPVEGEIVAEGEAPAEGEGVTEGETTTDTPAGCAGGGGGTALPDFLFFGAGSLALYLLGWRAGTR